MRHDNLTARADLMSNLVAERVRIDGIFCTERNAGEQDAHQDDVTEGAMVAHAVAKDAKPSIEP